MKAARIHEYGDADRFRVEDVEDPTPGHGQVLVEVRASAVNPVDYKMREGNYRAFVRFALPWIFGLDVSGVVRAVGPGVSRFSVGDEVYASPSHDLPGCYAELTCIREEELALKPPSLTHEEAASLPLVFETAWQCLVDEAGLGAGEHCFVQAGSGGVGTCAIQIAKALGARVTTTCSEKNFELVRGLGADRAVDYRHETFHEVVHDVDVCLDTLGTETMRASIPMMRSGGRIVGVTPNLPRRVARWGPVGGFAAVGLAVARVTVEAAMAGIRAGLVTRVPRGDTLEHCTRLVEAGQLRPVIDRVFPLDAIADAHRYLETGRARGKVVIAVGS